MSDTVGWHFVGEPPLATQGWKLYVSANLSNFATILGLVRPIFQTCGLPFKYAADVESLWRLNAGMGGYSQIGKSIVAYISDEACVPQLIAELKQALQPFRGTALRPPFATPIGAQLPLSFRYGAFHGDRVVLRGELIPDSRSQRQKLDDYPPCPFLPFVEVEAPDREINRFLLSYPIFSTLGQAAKGGVFAALDMDSSTYREVIVKLGRRNGSTLPDGRDGMDLLQHEHWFYSLMQGTTMARHAPALVDYAESDSAAALVLERIEGVTLLGLQMDGELTATHLHETIAILDTFHKCGYLVGDAKLANFIVSSTNQIKAIDFEAATAIVDLDDLPKYASFLFTDDLLAAHPCTWEKIHFLYSVMHFAADQTDSGNKGSADRVICLRDVLASDGCLSPIAAEARRLARELFGTTQ